MEKMPVMEDTREPVRFTQNEAATYQTLVNAEVPDDRKEFVRFMWYARIPTSVWNDNFMHLSKPAANGLLKGKATKLDEHQQGMMLFMTQVAQEGITRGILPCSDNKAIAAVVNLLAGVVAQKLRQTQQVETA